MQGKPAGKLKTNDLIAAVVFFGVAFTALLIVRFALFYYESFDFIHSLSVWTARYRAMSFWEGLGTKVGNYNQPYMYLINIISRVSTAETEIYYIKALSVIFDVVLAFFVSRLVSVKYKSVNMQILAFLLAFAVPTVIINGALWGQCEAIYTSFAVGAVYFALCDSRELRSRSRYAYAFIALAVSFKLQAAFIFPLFVFFIINGRITLRDCWVFFAVFFAFLLPAFFAGFPVDDLLLVYIRQSGTYSYLTMNAINIWQFMQYFSYESFEQFRLAGLYAGGAAVLGLMYFTYVNRERLVENVDYVRLAFLFAVLVPFLLPQMHDRFFFMADIFALAVFMFDKRRWYVPLVCIFCSFVAYSWLIMDYVHVFDVKTAVLGLTVVIFVVLRDFVMSLTDKKDYVR